MKTILPETIRREMESLIEERIEKIKFDLRREEIKNHPEWKDAISMEALKDLWWRDVNVSSQNNLMKFDWQYSDSLLHVVKSIYPNYRVYSSGHFYYPKTGYMGWHTNSNEPQKRVYLVYALEDQKSFFRYYKKDSMVTDYDNRGLNVREFEATDKRPFFWHCVGSECDRYSFGFKLLSANEPHN